MNDGPTVLELCTSPTLDTAQEIVGGFVELVCLQDGAQMLVDEEGLLKGLPYNTTASAMAGKPIVGNVILLRDDARWD